MKLVEAMDMGDVAEIHIDGVCGVYRVSQNVIIVELYANKIVDGKVEKVVVLRSTWDRSCWTAAQEVIQRVFVEVAALPMPAPEEGERTHH